MIKYKLTCKSCNQNFDSWFASPKEFDKLKRIKLINCSFCSSSQVVKSPMSPMVLNSSIEETKIDPNQEKLKKFKKRIKKYQDFIKSNFEYVGKNFAYEARSIHYNTKKKNAKGIYGNASHDEVKSLNEEGIETQTIPWIGEKEN